MIAVVLFLRGVGHIVAYHWNEMRGRTDRMDHHLARVVEIRDRMEPKAG